MHLFSFIKYNKRIQYLIGFGAITLTAIIAHFYVDITGYKVVALLMLLIVSVVAMAFDIWPVVWTAVYSALVWNFFFIPPVSRFTIDTPEDALLFLMYFVIALLNAVLSSKIRKTEIKAKEEEEQERTILLYNTVLNSLSHEFKTPISAIIGATDTLKESPSKLTEENRKALLSEIETAGTRLNRQVNNLLNMSRLESGFIQLQLDWCDMSELVHQVVQSLAAEADGYDIYFEQEAEIPLFKLDRGLIEQVLYNILHNALQHTPAGTMVRIKVEDTGGNCQITIADNGPGFPSGSLSAVFKKFYRLPGSPTGGTGLGLSIAKGFVEAHNGRIDLAKRAGGGAEFTITIPSASSYIKDLSYD